MSWWWQEEEAIPNASWQELKNDSSGQCGGGYWYDLSQMRENARHTCLDRWQPVPGTSVPGAWVRGMGGKVRCGGGGDQIVSEGTYRKQSLFRPRSSS